MANNILLGRIASIDNQASTFGATTLRGKGSPAVTNVKLQDGTACNVNSVSKNAAHLLRMLQMLQHAGVATYLETDPNTNEVRRLLIPEVLRVDRIAAAANGNRLEVHFRGSSAIHFLSTTNPNFQSLLDDLKDAQKRNVEVQVTNEPDRPEIIHVSPAVLPLTHRATAVAPTLTPAPTFSISSSLAPISLSQAQAMFDLVNAETCPTNASSSTCIPFLYPDDGCWARAHQMCRIMISNGVVPGKVWIYGTLHVNTNHSPVCGVDWGWHVAPVVVLDTGDEYVIDPSLFDSSPVALAEWIAIQNTSVPPSSTEFADASVYQTARLTGGSDEYDPGYSLTAAVLNRYRMKFANRCTMENPPGPPYTCP